MEFPEFRFFVAPPRFSRHASFHALPTVVGDIPGSHDFQGCARESSRNRQFVLRHPRTNGHRVIGGDVFTFSRIVSIHDPRGGCTLPRSGRCVFRIFFQRRFIMSEKTYFDLHITGVGYLNRIREVKPKKGEPFLACDIAALNGASDKVSYVRFDTRVSGADAQHLVRRCKEAVEAEQKVLIGFKLGDLWTDIFTYAKGKHAGEQAVSLKARLLFISWIKIDGELIYKAEKPETPEVDAAEAEDFETNAENFSPEVPEASDFVPEDELVPF
jgi:hypothetical protein